MNKEQEMYFDQCMDFLARMIEKYGDQIRFPDLSIQENSGNSDLITTRKNI